MIALGVLPRPVPTKVDISLLLGTPDEEEKKKAKSITPGSSSGSGPLESAGMPNPSRHGTRNPEESVDDRPEGPAPSAGIKRARDDPAPEPVIIKKQSKWSPEEDALIIELRGSGMKWEDISKRLPGRSAISCRLHYQNYLERRSEWDEDKKNKLARLYERFKSEMWSKIAEEMAIPWRAAEAMHWQMGESEMAKRAGVVPFYLSSTSTDPSRSSGRSVPSKRPKREPHSRSIHGQLPSVAELTAGVPAYALEQQSPYAKNPTRPRTRSRSSR